MIERWRGDCANGKNAGNIRLIVPVNFDGAVSFRDDTTSLEPVRICHHAGCINKGIGLQIEKLAVAEKSHDFNAGKSENLHEQGIQSHMCNLDSSSGQSSRCGQSIVGVAIDD